MITLALNVQCLKNLGIAKYVTKKVIFRHFNVEMFHVNVQQPVNLHKMYVNLKIQVSFWHILMVSCVVTVTEGIIGVIHHAVDLKFVVVVDDVMTFE